VSPLRLPKSNAGSSTILLNELNAGRLQRALNRFEVVRHGNGSACLEISNGAFTDFRFGGQVGLRKLDQGARGAALRRCHLSILTLITFSNKDTELRLTCPAVTIIVLNNENRYKEYPNA
jgi:hypothetical protein